MRISIWLLVFLALSVAAFAHETDERSSASGSDGNSSIADSKSRIPPPAPAPPSALNRTSEGRRDPMKSWVEEMRVRWQAKNEKADCDSIDHEKARRICREDVARLRRLNCSAEENGLCDRTGQSYAARAMVRYRHELNERCRGLTGQNRSACERAAQQKFKDYLQHNFKEWKQQHMNQSESELKNDSRRLHELREKLHEAYAQHKENITSRMEERAKNLSIRLEHQTEAVSRHSGLLQKAIDRVQAKGYDASELEFLLEEFNTKIDDAKIFYTDGKYRDALASLKEARQVMHEFREKLAQIVREHNAGRTHVVRENDTFNSTTEGAS